MTIPHQHNGQSADTRPLTDDQAETLYPAGSGGADQRFSELSQRDLSARAAAILPERREFDPENNLGHKVLAEAEPLTAPEAGASREQIGAARGRPGASRLPRADGQHSLLSFGAGKIGMSDADYAAAYTRSADPETYPGGRMRVLSGWVCCSVRCGRCELR
jgi:hypothetical protein